MGIKRSLVFGLGMGFSNAALLAMSILCLWYGRGSDDASSNIRDNVQSTTRGTQVRQYAEDERRDERWRRVCRVLSDHCLHYGV